LEWVSGVTQNAAAVTNKPGELVTQKYRGQPTDDDDNGLDESKFVFQLRLMGIQLPCAISFSYASAKYKR
jgi:hypothetical protein